MKKNNYATTLSPYVYWTDDEDCLCYGGYQIFKTRSKKAQIDDWHFAPGNFEERLSPNDGGIYFEE